MKSWDGDETAELKCTVFEVHHRDAENQDKPPGMTQELGCSLALCIAAAKLTRKDCPEEIYYLREIWTSKIS